MKTKLLSAAVALSVICGVSEGRASTYAVSIDYNLLTGTISPPSIGSGFTEFESANIAVNLPTLYVGDVINTTINFTQGLALNLSSPGTQLFNGLFTNSSANG